jgi:hypothetical protein
MNDSASFHPALVEWHEQGRGATGGHTSGTRATGACENRKALRLLPALSVQIKTFAAAPRPKTNSHNASTIAGSALMLTVTAVRIPTEHALSGPRRRTPGGCRKRTIEGLRPAFMAASDYRSRFEPLRVAPARPRKLSCLMHGHLTGRLRHGPQAYLLSGCRGRFVGA